MLVHHLIVLKQVFTNAKVVVLYLLLCGFDGIAERLMLNLLIFGNSQRIKHGNHPLGAKKTHQIIFQGNIKLGLARISLTAGTTAQLVVNTPGFMTLRTNNFKASGLPCRIIKLNIRTTARHVGGDGNGSMNTCIRHNFSLQLVKLGV